jgi:hypothetical protein
MDPRKRGRVRRNVIGRRLLPSPLPLLVTKNLERIISTRVIPWEKSDEPGRQR